MTAAPIVQPISSGVLPRICSACPPRLARYLTRDQISVPSTISRIGIETNSVILYSVSILSAFGEPPLSGVKMSAAAGPARTSSAASASAQRQDGTFGRTRRRPVYPA